MKKLFVIFAITLLPMVVMAEAVEIDGICYTLIPKAKAAKVTANPVKYSGNVVIPASITYNDEEFSVDEIESSAFSNCSDLTSVIIPNTVESIGSNAFSGCGGLTSLDIPEGVTIIEESAFSGCWRLTVVVLPNGLKTIKNGTFNGCTGLTSVSIPNSVTDIGNGAFRGCTALTSLTIPNSVTTIDNYAFEGCGLTSVDIPNSMTHISQGTFMDCRSLASVTIPNSIKVVFQDAFFGCNSLNKVQISDIAAWCMIDFAIRSNPLIYAKHLFLNGDEVIDLTIPNSVTKIGSGSFSGCTGLNSVTIPNGVTSIGEYTFSGCSDMVSVDIANSVKEIGMWAFSGCSSLTSVTLPNNLTNLTTSVFQGCSGLTSINVPSSVTSIEPYAFKGCSSLASIAIPNGVTVIGCESFKGCGSMTSVSIPYSVTTIEYGAFEDCCSLVSLDIPLNVKSIPKNVFRNCISLTSVVIPNSVISLGDYSFSGCSSLNKVTIGSGIKEMGAFAFASCKDLLDVYCLAESVPTSHEPFKDSHIEYSTLHVPSASIQAYKFTDPWKDFKSIVALNDEDIPVADSEKCATPEISISDGELNFKCETEDVTFVTTITCSDAGTVEKSVITLSGIYDISTYAKRQGYLDSDVTHATICWMKSRQNDETSILDAPAKPLLIRNNYGVLSIVGADEGSTIQVFDLQGRLMASGMVIGGNCQVVTSLHVGDTAIVKVGEKSIKVLLR